MYKTGKNRRAIDNRNENSIDNQMSNCDKYGIVQRMNIKKGENAYRHPEEGRRPDDHNVPFNIQNEYYRSMSLPVRHPGRPINERAPGTHQHIFDDSGGEMSYSMYRPINCIFGRNMQFDYNEHMVGTKKGGGTLSDPTNGMISIGRQGRHGNRRSGRYTRSKSFSHSFNNTHKFSSHNDLYKPRENIKGTSLCFECRCGRTIDGPADTAAQCPCYDDYSIIRSIGRSLSEDLLNDRHVYDSNLISDQYTRYLYVKENNVVCDNRTYQCIRCKFHFKRLSTLKIHVISHLGGANFFNCTRCTHTYKSYYLLKRHGLKEHKELIPNNNYSELKIFITFLKIFCECYNPFVSSFCFNCFTYPKNVQLHPCKGKYVYTKVCMLCGSTISSIKEHILNGYCTWKEYYEFKQ